jgi:hypothetical protein
MYICVCMYVYICMYVYMYVCMHVRGPFAKFVDSTCYSESELCGGTVTVSFFEVPPLASDALLTTLHPLLENVMQTVDHFEISRSSLFMVGKAQKSHGARSGLYGGCSNGVPPIHFPIRFRAETPCFVGYAISRTHRLGRHRS